MSSAKKNIVDKLYDFFDLTPTYSYGIEYNDITYTKGISRFRHKIDSAHDPILLIHGSGEFPRRKIVAKVLDRAIKVNYYRDNIDKKLKKMIGRF